MASSDETVYCICRKSYDGGSFMIECDVCRDWFHGSCVGIQEYQASDIEIYHCPNCQPAKGPLLLKKRRNYHRHDYSESDDNISKAVQTGTVMFIHELKNRTFPGGEEIPLLRLRGSELTKEYLETDGFDVPILVEKKDGLDMRVPPSSFTIQDVENHVGSMREIDVIDVARQDDYKMFMREWTDYYNSPNRRKIFNVISLEFSNTKLEELVEPPRIVRELSWVSQYWPSDLPVEDVMFEKPEVQRYCLMGVKDCFTDFHIDFGGTSVWYHVLRGEKIFYFIRPTPTNLALYERWVSSSNQSEMFFADQVDVCYKCVIKQGHTVFIPNGWIHAVLTPIDSLVFGGNFLHSLNMSMQIQVYEIEKNVKTPDKYLFPNFETVHWYAAKHILDLFQECSDAASKCPEYLVTGARALISALKSWTNKKELVKKDIIPETISYGKLLKELQRELKQYNQKAKEKVDKKKKRKKSQSSPDPKQLAVESFHNYTQKRSSLKDESSDDISQEEDDMAKESVQIKPVKAESKASPGMLVRVPKAGAYMDMSVYDFKDDEDDGATQEKKPCLLNPPSPPPDLPRLQMGSVLKPEAKSFTNSPSGIRLKLLGGKVVSNPKESLSPPGAQQVPGNLSTADSQEPDSEDEDKLVVDNSPSKLKLGNTSNSTIKPGSLKLKLSFKGGGGDADEKSPEAVPFSSPGRSADRRPFFRSSALGRAPGSSSAPVRGGLNGSIADILQASGYDASPDTGGGDADDGGGGEGELKIDEGLGRGASPAMRDAIQGMLSMSRLGGFPLSPTSTSSPRSLLSDRTRSPARVSRARNLLSDEEPNDKMPTCYKDEEFVYPTLDISDTEDEHVFRPRGKSKKDETWNPKARLHPTLPKPDRPHREGTRRESVESGLAAAAAKLATMPRPKRQYVRRKSRQDKKPESSLASTSSGSRMSSNAQASFHSPKRPGAPVTLSKSAKKPKKGMATAKQRLGKILKIHKMGMF